MGIILVMQWNQYLHIPNELIYVISGSFAGTLEGAFQGMPTYIIFTKLVPIGIEGTIMCTYTTFVGLCNSMFKEYLGVFLNDRFFHVSKENMDNFVWTKVCTMCCNFIPLYFIYIGMIPTLAESNKLQEDCIAMNDGIDEEDEEDETVEGLLNRD